MSVTEAKPHSRGGKILRWTLPFIVSGVFLAYLFWDMDLRAIANQVTSEVFFSFIGPLIAFMAVSLVIEARCLVLVVRSSQHEMDHVKAARIKAASYLLGLLNYALGAAGLSVLLRRQGGLTLGDSVGKVFLIGLFDLGSLLALVAIGGTFLGFTARGVQAGVVVALVGLIVAGFVFLRAPISLGPLDRLRELSIFGAARTVRLPTLIELALLRLGFVLSFVLLAWGLFWSFGLSIPPVNLVMNVSIMLLVAALPIAAAGLGTGQLVFVELFGKWAESETLMAASLTLSAALIVARAGLGLLFAREFTREAFAEASIEPKEPIER